MQPEEDSQKSFLPPLDPPRIGAAFLDDEEMGDSFIIASKKKGGKKKGKKGKNMADDIGRGIGEHIMKEKHKIKLGQVVPRVDDKLDIDDPFGSQKANNGPYSFMPLKQVEISPANVGQENISTFQQMDSSLKQTQLLGQLANVEEEVDQDEDQQQEEGNADESYMKNQGQGQEGEEEDEEHTELSWAMKIGAPPKKDDTNQILEDLKPKECDVYPLSIRFTDIQKRRIKILRILSLIFCFYLTVPFDLYIPSDERIGYFGTHIEYRSVKFEEMDSNFTFQLKNCKLYLEANGDNSGQLDLQFGYSFGQNHTLNTSIFEIRADPVETCIVNLRLPTGVPLPKLVFNMTGTQDNIMFDDSKLGGKELNFSNGLEIFGDVAYIILNNHYMSYLNVSMKFSTVYLSNIRSKVKNVTVNAGLYSDILPVELQRAYIRANQKDGNICLFSNGITQTSNTSCPIIHDPFNIKQYNTTYCVIDAYMCQNNTGNCTFTLAQAEQLMNVTVYDGSIQVKQQQTAETNLTLFKSVYQQTKTSVSLASQSFLQVNISATNFYSDTANDRIAVLQTLTPSYQKTWFYTNKVQILQAQYWPLAWGSVGLLRPVMEKMKVILIDYKCPARAVDLQIDSDVDYLYYLIFPRETISQGGFIEGYSTFKIIALNDFGERVYQKINFKDNPRIVACFAIAATIAIVGACFAVQLSYMAAKVFKRKYNNFLLQQKQLAISKKQATSGATQTAAQVQNMILEFESQNKIYEHRGLCSTAFFQMEPDEIAKQKLKFNFSLFQIPALILDYIFRQKIINSLQVFLSEIDDCKYQFSSKRLNATDKSEVSMTLKEFQALYSDFCQKNGYREIDVEKNGEQMFKKYQIKVESQEDKKRPAYVNLRFKTSKEKLESDYDDYSEESSVRLFLKSECQFSSFEQDFLFFEELNYAYYNFCRDQGIQESQQEQIIGSDDMTNFGSTTKEMAPPQILIGIKKGKAVNPKNLDLPLVRRPAKLKTNIMSKITSLDGIGPNLALTLVLYILILIVPLVTPMVTFLALSEMTRLQESVFKRQITFLDFYATNRLDPWWDNTPYIVEAAYIHIYVLIYLVFAFIELVSFFMTGLDNNGKFPIKFKPAKRIIMIIFYVLLGIFIFYYIAMLWFALVWCLLSAILNPSKFLPYTAAALAFIGTIAAKFVIYKIKYQLTIKSYQGKVSQRMATIFQQTLGKVKSQGAALASKLPMGGGINQGKLGSALGVKLDEGGAGVDLSDGKQLAQAASKGLDGLQPCLIELTTAIIIKDKAKIQDILIKQMSKQIDMDPELLQRLSDIAMSEFNPAKSSRQLSYGVTELAIKQFFRKLFPALNVDLFDQLITLVLQRDPNSIISLLNNVGGLDKTVFEILNAIKFKNKDQIKKQLFGLHSRLLGKENESIHRLFKILYQLREGEVQELLIDQSDLDDTNNTTTNQLNFKHCFPSLCIIGLKQNSSTLDTLLMTQSIKEVLSSQGLLKDKEKEEAVKNFNSSKQIYLGIEQLYLALFYIIRGEQIDMKRISTMVQGQGLSINGDMMEIMHMCSQNSLQSFEQILIKLNCTLNKPILIEFYQLMQKQKVKFMNICSELLIPEDSRETFTYLIYLLYRIIKYDIIVRKSQSSQQVDSFNKEISILRYYIKECLDEIEFNEKNVKFYEFEEFKEILPKELKQKQKSMLSTFGIGKNDAQKSDAKDYQTLNNEMLNSKETKHDEEEGDEGTNSQAIKELLKKIFSNIDKDKVNDEPKTLHKLLWAQIQSHDDIKKIIKNDEILSFIRSSAFLLLKSDSLLSQTDPDYMKCYNELGMFYDIESEKFELLIDLITGNPLDLFNLISKTLEYSIKTDTNFKGTFDPNRLHILSSLLQGSRRSLTTACMNWYHQYRYFSEGKRYVQAIMKIFKLNHDFLQILSTRRLTQSEDNLSSYQEEYIKQIKSYLKQQIQLKKQNPKETPNYSTNLTITPMYFTNEEVKDEDGVVQQIQEVELLNMNDQSKILTLMEKLILIKQYDQNLIKQVISQDRERPQKYVDLIRNLLQVTSQTTPSKALNTVLSYAQCVPLFEKLVNWYEDKISKFHQDMFVQFNLVIHASQFNVLFNKNEGSNFLTNKSLISLIDLTNEALANDQNIFYVEERDFRRALQALYENNYFQDIANKLFSFLLKNKDEVKQNHLLGVLLGSAVNDKKLLVQSVMNLLKNHDLKQDVLQGFGSVLTQDIEEQEKIKALCKQLEIDGDFLIRIMDLVSKKTKNLPSVIMDLLAGHDEEQSKICTSFLYVMKGDLTMVKSITQQLGIEASNVTAILASASGNFNILAEFYQLIQEKLGMTSQKSVRYFLQMAHGDSQCIQQLQQKRSQNFQIYDAGLVEAVFNITYIGGRMYTGHANMNECEQIRKLDSSINAIAKKITDVFDLEADKSNKLNNSLKILIKSCWNDQRSLKALYKKLQNGTGKKSYWYSESKSEVSNCLTQYFTEKEILKFIRNSLKIVVEDRLKLKQLIEQKHKEMLKYLKNTLLPQIKKMYTGKEDEEENEAKAKEEEKKKEEEKLNQPLQLEIKPAGGEGGADGDKKEMSEEEKKKSEEQQKKKQEEELKKKLQEEEEKKMMEQSSPKKGDKKGDKKGGKVGAAKEDKKGGYLSWLGFGQKKQESEEDKFNKAIDEYYNVSKTAEDDKNVERLKEDIEKKSYRIGCTFGLSLYRMISQPLYYCQTCNEQLGVENLGVCIICAQFCHKGHKLVEASYGQNTRSICDCGAGKFNKCPVLSENSPIESCREKKECSVIRQNFVKIQDSAIEELGKKIVVAQQEMDEFEIYQRTQFLVDLTKALQLPQYFNKEKDPKMIEELGKNVQFKNVRSFLLDESLKSYICVAENLLLMAFGQITNSFLTIIGNKKKFSSDDLQNQSLYTNHENQNTTIYNTMGSFVAIAQADYSKLQQFGIGLAEVLGEKGSKELTAEDKFSNVIRLARGGKLARYDPDLGTGSQLCRNSYARLFQQMFGINGKSIMILHYMLTMSNQQLVEAMGFKEDEEEDEAEIAEDDSQEKVNLQKMERQNVQAWVDLELFSNFLQMTDYSVEYCKSIVGIMCKYKKALDFIANQKDIGMHKLQVYKALVFSKKEIELQPIFQRVNSFLPLALNCQLRKVWKGDMKSLIEFLVKYIEVDGSGGDWSKEEDFNCSMNSVKKSKAQWDKLKERANSYEYLSQLYQLMIGDTTDQEKVIEEVYQKAYYGKVIVSNKEEPILDKERILNGLYSIAGILYNDNIMQPKIAITLDIPELSCDIISSLIAVVNQQWGNSDIQKVLKLILKENIDNKALLRYCKNLLQATEGDIVSLAKIEDEILIANGTYLRSFIVSAITGQIQFDSLIENEKGTMEDVRKQRNLLRRECYRIFEKITRDCYPQEELKDDVEKFIKFSFDQKFPLHLLGLMSQDRNFLSKLINGTDEFVVNLMDENFKESYKKRELTISKLDQKKKYLKTFIDFLDPYNIEVQLKPLLELIQNQGTQITIQKDKNALDFNCLDALGIKGVKISRFKDKIMNDTDESFNVDAHDLTQMFYNCFTLDRRATTLIFYYLAKIYENSPILSQILQIQQKFIEGKSIFEHLNSIVLLIMAQSKRLEMCEDMDFKDKEVMLIKQVTVWLDGIMLMLSKDKTQNIPLISNKFREIIKGLIDYYGDDPSNPFIQRKDNISFIVDSLIGLVSIIKGDFSNMKSLAVKLGGFPSIGKLDGFVKILRDNKNSIKFNEVKISDVSDSIGAFSSMATGMIGQAATAAGAAAGTAANAAQDAVNNGAALAQQSVQQVANVAQQGIQSAQNLLGDDPVKLLTNPKLIFEKFANKRGTMSFENFQAFLRMIGLPITHAQMIKIFSIADKGKTGEIDVTQFKNALNQIKTVMIKDTLEQLGLSITDLVISGIFSIVILLLLFAFIFVGIEAFAPSSSFSSVTNTSLPLVAGGSVNSGGGGQKPEDDDQDDGAANAIEN